MILIAGDGASGSSYLVWLLRELGFTTCPAGYEQFYPDLPTGEPVLYELLREKRIRDAIFMEEAVEWPDVIKHSGGFSVNLHEWVDRFNWDVDLVLIPTRGLEEGIRRRWVKDPVNNPINHKFLQVEYKTFCGMNKDQVEARARQVLRERLGTCIYACIERDYPYAVLPFPKLVEDPVFLYEALQPAYHGPFDHFYNAYARVTDLSKAVVY